MNCGKTKQKIVVALRNFADVGVIGLSGGADSLLVTLLSIDAFGKDKVIVIGMPYGEADSSHFNSLSRRYASHLGISYIEINVAEQANAIVASVAKALNLTDAQLSKLNQGNARSRARANILYGVSHHLNENSARRVRVIGTGNLSEDFIGYDTKGGDALADIFPIGHLFKSEVYTLLEYYRDRGVIEEWMINRVPSAGLWEGQTDEGEIGYSYNEMEASIRYILRTYDKIGSLPLSDLQRFVWKRHLAHKHKHEAAAIVLLRDPKGDLID